MQLSELIEFELNLPRNFVTEAISKAHSSVRNWKIDKRSGGKRVVSQPSSNVKVIQYWLMINIFSQFELGPNAYAFIKGRSIRENAQAHSRNRYFVKVDLKDFFPSLTFADLQRVFSENYSNQKYQIQEILQIVKHCCFDNKGRLPIGFSSSPVISNIIMKEFDEEVSNCLESLKLENCVYTRYADDLVISSRTKNVSNQILIAIKEVIKNSTIDISINEKKISFTSASGGSAIMTGLKICSDGHITLPRKTKDFIRLLLSLYASSKIRPDQKASLEGYLSFCRDSDPAFYTKINRKFFKEISKLAI